MKNPNLTADDLRAIGERVYFNRETLRNAPGDIAAALRLVREMTAASESTDAPEWCSSGAIYAVVACAELAAARLSDVLTEGVRIGEDDGDMRELFEGGAQ